jgi:hypothetical protein
VRCAAVEWRADDDDVDSCERLGIGEIAPGHAEKRVVRPVLGAVPAQCVPQE